ncbi:hypothetical protein [Actinotalea sp.]|uniref:AMIN-like domain-containing (lipo)protein n=1 Tax=Actinotalea sp. TaxID=1872145 RepID=UPI0035642E3D
MQLRRRSTGSVLAMIVTSVLVLVACTQGAGSPESTSSPPEPSGSTSTPTASPTTAESPTAGPSPTATATSEPGSTDGDGGTGTPAFPADTSPDTGEMTGDPSAEEIGTLADLRVGAHDGYDRVVFELTGPSTPGWDVRYVPEAIGDPSGLPVAVPGDAILEVTLFSVMYPEGVGSYQGPSIIRAAGTTAVTEVNWTSLFEGYLQAFIGVSGGEHPFRAFALTDPARIVVDVRTD